ncbi:WD repeat-containing protein-like protein [Corynespora cassiicola Philippines]|uniref:WD repeat-containing protein-like protein n=1 Tax=Corynespora cassiicola Philippines TaxID=1448308 RepID=A0A2T2NKV5_CORCC|nr:WD repeat-containing protein-like protein [Corynespora cassiicola Philippines]
MSSPPSSAAFELEGPVLEPFCSSPPAPMPSVLASRKPKRPPPITPKRFTRFFTPRSSVHGSSSALGSSGRQLQDITRAAVNRRNANANQRSTPRKTVNFADVISGDENAVTTPQMASRKRKSAYMSPETSPAQSSPSKRTKYISPTPFEILEDAPEAEVPAVYPAPIRRLKSMGTISRTLERSFGGSLAIGRGFLSDHCTSWESQTADFYSSSDDIHELPNGATPFCSSPSNYHSLVAVGDEQGYVTLLDSRANADFQQAPLSWRAHKNALMDVQFSSNDTWMATGSGDQTGQIIDVRTQDTISVLAKHRSSVKQIRFQPGDDRIVATSSRDGAVQIWDLRCKGGDLNYHSCWGRTAPYVSSVRSLMGAHADSGLKPASLAATKPSAVGKSESYSRRGEISVTSLSFLPMGREHLLLTASDASTSVKVWDIRGRYSLRGPAVPISTTVPPDAHTHHRHFGINSLTLSGDASRLYALSKDNTIYAYSTNHLVLGAIPDSSARPKLTPVDQKGLGPLYGFRHRNFHAGSFYVKAALRKASGNRPELLAVGSTDGSPVVFPTDEKFLKQEMHRGEEADDLPGTPTTTGRSTLSRSSTSSRFPSTLMDTIPIYEQGTALVRGHEREVTGVAWAYNGTLVSVGDDLQVRRWREGKEARELRQNGESGGRRWKSGWAQVNDGFDDDDD